MTESIHRDPCGSPLRPESSFCGACGASARRDQDSPRRADQQTGVSDTHPLTERLAAGRRRMTVRRVGALSVGKISLVTYGLVAGVIGLVLAVVALFTAGPWAAIGVLIGVPVFYGIAGFLGGLLFTWLYNVAAGWVGGVEIDVE